MIEVIFLSLLGLVLIHVSKRGPKSYEKIDFQDEKNSQSLAEFRRYVATM